MSVVHLPVELSYGASNRSVLRGYHMFSKLTLITKAVPVALGGLVLGSLVATPQALAATRTVCTSGCDYTTIQSAVTAASPGDTISIGQGTFRETVTISKTLNLQGVGDGTDGTVINPVSGNGIFVNTASNVTVNIADIRVTGATGDGLLVGGAAPLVTVNVTGSSFVSNAGRGIHFNNSVAASSTISNSKSLSNGASGIRVATNVKSMTMAISGSTIASNVGAGLDSNPSGEDRRGFTNSFTIADSQFSGNVTGQGSTTHDISLYGFNGNLNISNVEVIANHPLSSYAVSINGYKSGTTFFAPGSIAIDGLIVTGSVKKGGLYFGSYTDLSGVTLNNVDLKKVSAPWGQVIVEASSADKALPLGNTSLLTAVTWAASGIDATSAAFYKVDDDTILLEPSKTVADGYQIEDQVRHAIDESGTGIVRWYSGHLYVTPNRTGYAELNSLSRAYALAGASDTLHVKPGIYSDGTISENGDLAVSGVITLGSGASLVGDVDVQGTLKGNGTIAGDLSVQPTGTLAPGASPGKIILNGDLDLAGTLAIDLVGKAGTLVAGTDFDQLVVNGTVTLDPTSAILSLTFSGAALTTSGQYVIIDNDGDDDVNGFFKDQMEGSIVSSGGQSFRLTYKGGSGNDIALTLSDQTALSIVATATQKYGQVQSLSTSGGSGAGAVSYQVTGPCTIVGSSLTMTSGIGTCEVVATKAAAEGYSAATASASIAAAVRTIELSANDVVVTYGAAPSSFTYSVGGDGFINGNTFTNMPSCSTTYSPGSAAGRYVIECVASVNTDLYTLTYRSGTLTVNPLLLPANAVEYTGRLAFQSKSPTDTSVIVPLEAQIDFSSVLTLGTMNISHASVMFVDFESGKILAKDVKVSTSDVSTGIATAWVTLMIGPNGMSDYQIKVLVGGSFSGDNSSQESNYKLISVSLPSNTPGAVVASSVFISGTTSGSLVPSPATVVRIDMFFQNSSVKKVTSLKGQLTASWDGPSGSTYWLKSNSITSILSNGTTATVSFRASLWLENADGSISSIDGNVIGQAEVTEGTEVTLSKIGITAQSSKNSLLYLSSNWVKSGKSYATIPTTVTQGIITVN